MPQQTINTPRDTTLQATNTALGLLAKDATIGATNTALGLLGKDASLQDIKAALLQIVAALDPTADDYDQLTNKPQVNGVTLSGNKSSKQLGIRQTIPLTSAQYAQLSSAEKMDVDKDYIITDANGTIAPIDDDSVSRNKVWSSYKVDDELDTLNSKLGAFGEYVEASIASGTEARSSLLNRLIALVDTTKITPRACLQFINASGQVYAFPLTTRASGIMYFSSVTGIGTSSSTIVQISTGANAYWRQCTIAATSYSVSDYISYNDIAGTIMRFYY